METILGTGRGSVKRLPEMAAGGMIAGMDELSYQPPIPPQSFQLRTGRLITAGILLILAACLCGCMTALIPISLVQARSTGQTRQLIQAIGLYLVITIVFGTLGIGALLPRRWCRPLILILSMHWLIIGVLTLLSLLVMFPLMQDAASLTSGNAPQGFLIGIMIVSGVLLTIAMIGWPLALLLLVRGDDVRKTCEWRDPIPRWTDGCPLNILGLSLTLVVVAAFAFYSGFQKILPIMGFMLHGPLAIAISSGVAIVLLLAALRVYRLQHSGWWLGLLGVVLPLLAYLPNAWLIPFGDYYAKAGIPPQQIAALMRHQTATQILMVTFPLLFAIAFTIYMIRLRPAFVAAAQERSRSAAA